MKSGGGAGGKHYIVKVDYGHIAKKLHCGEIA